MLAVQFSGLDLFFRLLWEYGRTASVLLGVSGVTGVWPECLPNQQETYPSYHTGPRPTQRVCKGKAPGHAMKAYTRVPAWSHAFVTSEAYGGELQIHAP